MRYLSLLCVFFLLGCPTAPPTSGGGVAPRASAEPPVAYIDGDPVRAGALRPALYETAGGAVLADAVLDRELTDRLAERGLVVTNQDLADERRRLLETLDPENENQAARLLRELRETRGLGDVRFEGLLRRNASLRKLVQEDVEITPVLVSQQYELRFGERYQPRIITAEALRDFDEVRRRLAAGQSFSDVAAELSTDLSAAQGGLLSPISPADPTYPQTLRNLLPGLEPGQVSDPIAIDGTFAMVLLERKVEAQPVEMDDVRDQLEREVRLRVEGALMNRLGRSLVRDAKVTVMDSALGESWRRQKAALGESP